MKALEGPEERKKRGWGRQTSLRGCTVLCQLPVGSSGSSREKPLLRRARRRGLKTARWEQEGYAQTADVKINLLRDGCRGRPAGGPKRELPSGGSRAGGLNQTPLPLWSEGHPAWGADVKAQKESPLSSDLLYTLLTGPRWAASYERSPLRPLPLFLVLLSPRTQVFSVPCLDPPYLPGDPELNK